MDEITSTGLTVYEAIPVASSLGSKQYGYYVTQPVLCPICNRKDHMEINLLRARDHLSYEEIARTLQIPGITPTTLQTHFKNHFLISSSQRKILELKEDSSPESLEIIHKIFEGDIDIFSASMSILQSQARRLSAVNQRLEFLNAHLEQDSVDDIDKQEFIQLNRVATDIENSMKNIYVIMDKKLFPSTKEELSNAILHYKLGVLSKIIDMIQLSLLELEKDPRFTEAILHIRRALAEKIGNVEDEILKSGGLLNRGT